MGVECVSAIRDLGMGGNGVKQVGTGCFPLHGGSTGGGMLSFSFVPVSELWDNRNVRGGSLFYIPSVWISLSRFEGRLNLGKYAANISIGHDML